MQHAGGPVAISAIGGAAAATVAWRARGVLNVTAVVKATFAILPGAPMAPIAPDPIERDEQDGDPGFGLRAAGDLAPYLGKVDVLLIGHAHAAKAAPLVTAEFAIVRDGATLIDKALELEVPRGALLSQGVSAERHHRPSDAPLPIRIPLAGMSPLSKHWPIRKQLLQGLDPRTLEGPIAALPEPFNWSYFQAAPLDQRIDDLQGNEWILLGSMHPQHEKVTSRLPGARGAARLYGRAPGLRGRFIPLTADTLSIDVDRQRCSMLWRGHFPVSSERELASLHIVAGVELPGRALTWVDPFPLAGAPQQAPPRAHMPLQSPGEAMSPSAKLSEARAPVLPFTKVQNPEPPPDLQGTLALSDEDAQKLSAAQATPFKPSTTPAVARVQSAPASKLDSALPFVPARPPPPTAPAPAPNAGAVVPQAPDLLEGTVAISREDAEKLRAARSSSLPPPSAPPAPRAQSAPASKLGPFAPPAPFKAPPSTAPQPAPNAGALSPEPPSDLFGTLAISDEDSKRLSTAEATPFKPSSTPAVARVPSLPKSKLGAFSPSAPVAAPSPMAPRPAPSAGAPFEEPPNPLMGTLAISDEDAARFKGGKATPFEAQRAPIPAAAPARAPEPAGSWREREVPRAAVVPLAAPSRPEHAFAAASRSAPVPQPSPPALSAPAAALGGAEPPRTLGEHFLAAMAGAAESSA